MENPVATQEQHEHELAALELPEAPVRRAPVAIASLREDEVRPSRERAEALRNAPARDPLGFVVPRVVSE